MAWARSVVLARNDHLALVGAAQRVAEVLRNLGRIVPIGFRQVDVGQADFVEPAGQMQDGLDDLRAVHVALRDEGRQADAGALGPDLARHGGRDLFGEARALGDAAAVGVGAGVGGGAHDLSGSRCRRGFPPSKPARIALAAPLRKSPITS